MFKDHRADSFPEYGGKHIYGPVHAKINDTVDRFFPSEYCGVNGGEDQIDIRHIERRQPEQCLCDHHGYEEDEKMYDQFPDAGGFRLYFIEYDDEPDKKCRLRYRHRRKRPIDVILNKIIPDHHRRFSPQIILIGKIIIARHPVFVNMQIFSACFQIV